MPVIPALWEAVAGGLQIGGKLWLYSKTLFQTNKQTNKQIYTYYFFYHMTNFVFLLSSVTYGYITNHPLTQWFKTTIHYL
jgi:predicted membrane channel-forming protein YqfA (hemolysin III family)